MHRLMVSSATYRQSSRLDADLAQRQPDGAVATNWRRAVQADPANVLLWRMNRRRLEGEAIRDAMLATSADLNMAHGGPSVRPPLPDEVVSTLLRKDHWEVSADPAQQRRRSIYVFVRRNLGFPMFEAFDKPDTNASCARRAQSTTAPQSLVLLNAQFALTAARRLAGQVLGQAVQPGDAADSAALVRACYRRALSRTPTADEQRLGEAFLRDQAQRLVATGRKPADLALPAPMARGVDPALAAALTDYCLTLFNLNEFIYVD